ncbi:MAG TPA: 2-oxo acid dehydrogenase subunit E2 [Chitinophagaceae bacterium]|nr:2-oxo acid dehydrogenase subunit E2 [Chitinophagaceae bacterium]
MAIAELIMPKMGESITEATILRWHKNVGDRVAQDETVLDIATDKVDSEVPSTVAGIITEVLFKVNDVVPVGAVYARVDVGATAAPQNYFAPAQTFNPPPVQPKVEEQIPFTPQQTQTTKFAGGNNRFFSPLVLNIANSEGISLSELERIPGTGADGRVSKKDVLQYIADKKAGKVPAFVPAATQTIYTAPPAVQHAIESQPQKIYTAPPVYVPPVEAPQEIAQPQPVYIPPSHTQTVATAVQQPVPVYVAQPVSEPAPVAAKPVAAPIVTPPPPPPIIETPKPSVELFEMDRMRKLIAKHMVDSKHTSAHVTSFAEADVTNMVVWRDKIKNDLEKVQGTKITFTPMFIECLIKVMKRYPILNSSVEGDNILIKNYYNIGMATALPNKNLIVPVIKNAENLSLVALTKSVNTLADNARNNKLKPEDIQGGTFTFTNVGTFGSLMGTPIINQPQVAILAVGVIKKRAVVIETDKGDYIGIRHMMFLSLSYDHRIIDGSVGASFLTDVAKEFEKWDVNRELKLVIKEQYVD